MHFNVGSLGIKDAFLMHFNVGSIGMKDALETWKASSEGGEGVWYQDDRVFFATKGDDRLWMLNTTAQTIEVVYDMATATAPNNILSGVDNITMTPFGEVLVAEDGGSMQVVVVYPDGVLVPLLQIVGQDQSEIAGIAINSEYLHTDTLHRHQFDETVRIFSTQSL